MRPHPVLLVLAAIVTGCVDVAPESDGVGTAGADTPAPAPDAEPGADAGADREPILLGETGFVLGPQGNTPVTSTSVALEGIEVPENAVRVILQLAFQQGVTVGFSATGLAGCEQRVELPSHVGGYERATECAPEPGLHTLTLSHTTGHVEGTARVLAVVG